MWAKAWENECEVLSFEEAANCRIELFKDALIEGSFIWCGGIKLTKESLK